METMTKNRMTRLKENVRTELKSRLIPFWTTRVIDQAQGGFMGEMSFEGVVDPRAAKGLILNARLLWTYSALTAYNQDPVCKNLACRAYQYVTTYFTQIKPLVLNLARATLEQGIDLYGGLSYEGQDGKVLHTYRDWWCQAEAVVGFVNAFELTADTHYLKAACDMWQCLERIGMDRQQGEWFWRVTQAGRPDSNESIVSQWKGPYHNVRACLEIVKRLK